MRLRLKTSTSVWSIFCRGQDSLGLLKIGVVDREAGDHLGDFGRGPRERRWWMGPGRWPWGWREVDRREIHVGTVGASDGWGGKTGVEVISSVSDVATGSAGCNKQRADGEVSSLEFR